MPKRPTLFQRVEQARRDVQDLYIEAIQTEPLMETHRHLLDALRALAAASEQSLPPAPKKARAKSADTITSPLPIEDRLPATEKNPATPRNASGI